MMKPNLQDQKQYYDNRWAIDTGINSLQIQRCAAILTDLSELNLSGPRILDFGCGNGWLTSILAHLGSASGVDLAPQPAMERFPHLTFYEADLTNWPPPVDLFDVLVSQEVIEHVEDQRGFLEVAANCLKPKGRLILTTPNGKTVSACTPQWKSAWLRQPVENILTEQDLRSLLFPMFEVIRVRSFCFGYGSSLQYRIANSQRIARIFDKLGREQLYSALLSEMRFGLHLIVTAEKR